VHASISHQNDTNMVCIYKMLQKPIVIVLFSTKLFKELCSIPCLIYQNETL
jgi:hypothetical protein